MLQRTRINIYYSERGVEKQSYTTAVEAGYKRYFNCTHHLARVSKYARLFYDYLCEKMHDTSNIVLIDNELIKSFCKLMDDCSTGKATISEKSVAKFISSLKSVQLIYPYRNEKVGLYQVNPKYAYKGSKREREKLIRNEVVYGILFSEPFNHLLDCTQEEFFKRGK